MLEAFLQDGGVEKVISSALTIGAHARIVRQRSMTIQNRHTNDRSNIEFLKVENTG
jgi:hypothetical protein